VQVEDSRRHPNHFARQLFDGLPPRYDLLADVLSMYQNRRWRHAMVGAVATSRPTTVLDVATGPGGVALQLADRTGGRITGLDLTPEMIGMAARNVARSPHSARMSLLVGSGEELPFADAAFDALTFTYLLRYVSDPAATIAELVRVVKPGGMVANLEFHVPSGPLWRPLWWMYTRMVLPAAGWATGGREWYDVGRFLGPSISEHYRRYPLDWHVEAWRRAGVRDIQVKLMSLGGGLVMWGRKAGKDG
jgi:demethylmenaquinone methyltransferase/2-methoxy-6-polyprenyl-1,4-benzoquinol methylase